MPELNQTDIERRFTFHDTDNPEVLQAYKEIRLMAKNFAAYVCVTVPDGREKSLAVTKIEEAVMWANAGIARSS